MSASYNAVAASHYRRAYSRATAPPGIVASPQVRTRKPSVAPQRSSSSQPPVEQTENTSYMFGSKGWEELAYALQENDSQEIDRCCNDIDTILTFVCLLLCSLQHSVAGLAFLYYFVLLGWLILCCGDSFQCRIIQTSATGSRGSIVQHPLTYLTTAAKPDYGRGWTRNQPRIHRPCFSEKQFCCSTQYAVVFQPCIQPHRRRSFDTGQGVA